MSTALALLTPSPTGVLGTGPWGAPPPPPGTAPWRLGDKSHQMANGSLDHLTLAFPSVKYWLGVKYVSSSQAE